MKSIIWLVITADSMVLMMTTRMMMMMTRMTMTRLMVTLRRKRQSPEVSRPIHDNEDDEDNNASSMTRMMMARTRMTTMMVTTMMVTLRRKRQSPKASPSCFRRPTTGASAQMHPRTNHCQWLFWPSMIMIMMRLVNDEKCTNAP